MGSKQVAPELLNKVTKALGITALDQWYYVSHKAVTQAIGSRALNSFGGTLAGFLKAAYPLHHFDEEKFTSKRSYQKERDQNFFEVIIRKLFPNTEIQIKARKAVGIVNPETDAYLEIDVWIPSLKLGIEYQDKHHFEYQWYANSALEDYQKRDQIKKDAMSKLGYTLVTIGYWWDKTIESVAATIRKLRPDLLKAYRNVVAEPIPPDPPPGNITDSPIIPGVAGIMNPFIPTSNFDPTNWYAGEKHDGIRGVYNPEMTKMFSRSGNELSVLPALLENIPNILVEGEIVAGRGNYSKTAGVTYHSLHAKVNWPVLRFVMYDIPDAKLGNYTYRYSIIAHAIFAFPYIFAQSASRVLVANKAHLKMFVDAIISNAGEGVIVQRDAQYEYGRAKGLAKIKVRRDSDAKVLRVNKRTCTCKLISGVTSDIGFSDDFDPSSLKEGDVVSYFYKGYLQSGKPKRGEIYKIRYDLNWEDIVSEKVQNFAKSRSVKEAIGSSSLATRKVARNKTGYWNKPPNVRAFFDKFASTAGFDPLILENWYEVTTTTLRKAGGGSVFSAHGDLMNALSCAYPELKFDHESFRTHNVTRAKCEVGYWSKPANVRAFLDEFAKKEGFDPLVPENWYHVRSKSLKQAGCGSMLSTYNKTKALSIAYPELKFDKSNSRTSKARVTNLKHKNGYWNKPPNLRTFFDEFARTSGFDPLVSENWAEVKNVTVKRAGGGGLLAAYEYNLNKALSRAYSGLKFGRSKKPINKMAPGYWSRPANARAYFDKFATTYKFNPLVPENWYPVLTTTLQNTGGTGVLRAYGTFQKALSKAYPDLKFQVHRFRTRDSSRARTKSGHWNESTNVRAFFDDFARKAGFDPLDPKSWHQVTNLALKKAGGGGMLNVHGTLKDALSHAYPELKSWQRQI